MAAVAQALAQVFHAAGYSPAGAAGIIGNLQQESSLNPASPGGGLAQWQGPRAQALQTYAQQQGRPVTDPMVQASFLVNEIRTQYPQLNQFLRTTSDPRAAALAVSQQYERPGVPMNQNRENYAVSALQQLGGSAGSPATAGAPGAMGAAQPQSYSVPVTSQTFDQAGFGQARNRYIAGLAVKASDSASNPFNATPGATKGFAQSLGGDSSALFQKGLLTTSAPNPQNFVSTQTKMMQVATGQLQKLAGSPLVNAHPGAQGDVNPIPGAVIGRTDMGVDANLKPGAPILAPNDAKVVAVVPGWYQSQPYVAVQLLAGPNKGKIMYAAEQITTPPPVGTVIRKGQPIVRYASQGTGIEIGWASPSNPTQTLAQAQGNTGDASHNNAPAGVNFRSYLGSL